jgi:hypothetical protein
MPEPTHKQFFYFFLFAVSAAVAVRFQYYGTAVFYSFCAFAVKEGW